MPLALTDDVYFCISEGQGVFLDLNHDAYNAIPLRSNPGAKERPSAEVVADAIEQHRAELVDAGLVRMVDAYQGDLLAYQSIPRPTSNIFAPEGIRAFGAPRADEKSSGIRPSDLVDSFRASYRASRLLKRAHIQEIVRGVRTRKRASTTRQNNLDDLREQTAIFRELRPWYPRAYLCLFDGLALVEFLARRGLFPDWIFGVQAQPFGAHCWVQEGEVLLNETTEYANQFTPIMTV